MPIVEKVQPFHGLLHLIGATLAKAVIPLLRSVYTHSRACLSRAKNRIVGPNQCSFLGQRSYVITTAILSNFAAVRQSYAVKMAGRAQPSPFLRVQQHPP